MTVIEPLELCSKRAFLGDKRCFMGYFGAFSLTFTDTNHVSMSVKPDIIRHEKCPNVLLATRTTINMSKPSLESVFYAFDVINTHYTSELSKR